MLIKIKVKPNSGKFKISLERDLNGPYLRVWLKSQPEKGKANKELLKELKKVFGEVEIVSGASSREKYIKVSNNIKIEEKLRKIESGKNIIFINSL
ncbi:MAG: YggU family protein [Candidatus Aenigmarchaeota archaeon]|nr:YggU family protein [Candidatus Aenigmarchaeota archaeon]